MDNFIDAVDLNTELSGLNLQKKGRGFRQKKKSVRVHLQLLVTESHTDRCHPFTKLPQYAGLVIFF